MRHSRLQTLWIDGKARCILKPSREGPIAKESKSKETGNENPNSKSQASVLNDNYLYALGNYRSAHWKPVSLWGLASIPWITHFAGEGIRRSEIIVYYLLAFPDEPPENLDCRAEFPFAAPHP